MVNFGLNLIVWVWYMDYSGSVIVYKLIMLNSLCILGDCSCILRNGACIRDIGFDYMGLFVL